MKIKLLAPLLLVLVLAIGCGSDSDTLMGSGSGSSPNPQTGAVTVVPQLTDQNVYFIDAAGLAVFLGEVSSADSGSNACNVVINLKVTLLTGIEKTFSIPLAGRIKLLSGKTNTQCLDKGETGSFRYPTDIPALLISDFVITSIDSEYQNISSPLLASSIELSGAIQETAVNSVRRYSGTLRNADTIDDAFFPSIVVTTLDSDGKVSGVFTAYLNADLSDASAVCQPDGSTDIPCLPHGSSLSFTVDTDLDPSGIADYYYRIYWLESADFI